MMHDGDGDVASSISNDRQVLETLEWSEVENPPTSVVSYAQTFDFSKTSEGHCAAFATERQFIGIIQVSSKPP